MVSGPSLSMETDFIGQQLSLFVKDDYILETVSQKAIFEENYALIQSGRTMILHL